MIVCVSVLYSNSVCAATSIPPHKGDIEKYLYIDWQHVDKLSSGWWRFRRDGTLFSYPFGHDYTYSVNNDELLLTHVLTGRKEKYRIVSISADRLLLEFYDKNNKKRNYDMAPKYMRINAGTIMGNVYHECSPPQEFSANERKSWFSVHLVGDYEFFICSFKYFEANGEYSEISTQAAYRRKGEKVIHIDPESGLGVFIKFGRWRIENEQYIVTESTAVVHYKNIDSYILGQRYLEELTNFNTDAPPIWMDRYVNISSMPEYVKLHNLAKQQAIQLDKSVGGKARDKEIIKTFSAYSDRYLEINRKKLGW